MEASCNSNSEKIAYAQCSNTAFINRSDAEKDVGEVLEKVNVCFYEESKALLTYSLYNGGTPAMDGHDARLELTTFTFDDASDYHAEDEYGLTININWGTLDVVTRPATTSSNDGSDIDFQEPLDAPDALVSHMNIHACKLEADETTCSIRFWLDSTINNRLQSVVYRGNEGAYDLSMALTPPGTWRVMGHVRYWVDDSTSVTK
eukprot:UN29773